MTKQELLDLMTTKFKDQMNLDLGDILTLETGMFVITPDNNLGLSMASMSLELSPEEHGLMGDMLQHIQDDK